MIVQGTTAEDTYNAKPYAGNKHNHKASAPHAATASAEAQTPWPQKHNVNNVQGTWPDKHSAEYNCHSRIEEVLRNFRYAGYISMETYGDSVDGMVDVTLEATDENQ